MVVADTELGGGKVADDGAVSALVTTADGSDADASTSILTGRLSGLVVVVVALPPELDAAVAPVAALEEVLLPLATLAALRAGGESATAGSFGSAFEGTVVAAAVGGAVTAARGRFETPELEDVVDDDDDEAEALRLRLAGTVPFPMRNVPLGPTGGREGGTATRREGWRGAEEVVVEAGDPIAGEPVRLGGADKGCGDDEPAAAAVVASSVRGLGFDVERFLPPLSGGASSSKTALLASFSLSTSSRFSLARWPALSKSAGWCLTVTR